MMQIAKVSLFLAGSAALTSAVRVTSRGRRMQPSDNPLEESKQSTDTPQACSVMASKFNNQQVAKDMVHITASNMPIGGLNFRELKDIAKDFLTERLKQLDSSVDSSLAADALANDSMLIGANWMMQPDAAEAVACAAVTSQLSTQQMATRNQRAEEMATMIGSGLQMGQDQVTWKGMKDISSEFLRSLAAKMDSVSYAHANAFVHASPTGAPNPSQASQHILSTKAMDKDINQDLELQSNRQKIAAEMVARMGAPIGGGL